MRKYKNKIMGGVFIAVILAFAFWYGGDAPGLHNKTMQEQKFAVAEKQNMLTEEKTSESKSKTSDANTADDIANESIEYPKKNESNTADGKPEATTAQESKPVHGGSENNASEKDELTCTLSIRCDTIINNIEWLDKEKVDIIPENGIIFAEKKVAFSEGESVFDLLLREMKRNKIHIEFKNTPMYDSAYIEGISNIYEFDCGELSGWMYKVNGNFPNYGCSRYQLKDGDKVEWVYTCNLGADVGGDYSARNGS